MQQAVQLLAIAKSRVSLDLALFLFTEQPSLLEVPPPQLARRMLELSTTLGIKQADVAHLLASNPGLLSAWPYE